MTNSPDPQDAAAKVAEEQVDGLARETAGLSQGQIVRKRFMHNTGAVASVVVFLAVALLAFTAVEFGPLPAGGSGDTPRRQRSSTAAALPSASPVSASTRSVRTTSAAICSP